jgi:transcriptional regulator with XRE-family HTH domain
MGFNVTTIESLGYDKGFPERLKNAIGTRSVRSFAIECGVSPTVMHQYLSGKSEPSRLVLVAIAKTAAVRLDWLAIGDGEIRQGEGGYYYEQISFEEQLFIDLVQASFETKGIEYPESRIQASVAYHLYRMIIDLRKDLLPDVEELKEMFKAFSVLFEKLIDFDDSSPKPELDNMFEHMANMIKSRALKLGVNE